MNEAQVKERISKFKLEWADFLAWIVGQTITRDKDGNDLYYAHDVERFIDFKYTGIDSHYPN